MVSLGQKLKIPKRCDKPLYDHIRVVVSKKQVLKPTNTGKGEHFENGRNWPKSMRYSPWKMVSLGQKLKMPKVYDKPLLDNIRVVVCKKPLLKTPNIPKMRAF